MESPRTMRFGSTAKVLLKCKLKYYRISECHVPQEAAGKPSLAQADTRLDVCKQAPQLSSGGVPVANIGAAFVLRSLDAIRAYAPHRNDVASWPEPLRSFVAHTLQAQAAEDKLPAAS